MTLLKKREALDIFINENNTISIIHPDVEDFESGKNKDVIITILPEDIDLVVSELLRLQKEYYEQVQEEVENE
ncbi:hypothetical protein [Acinetobacter johnsonii]|jgi:hypothetical protein|uniref:hypothetical protein n=1 Tax=Acinetobacter johnsonii TaxID=40214 RepID=UPI0022E7325D|nr:hypothetical protein [Acinetobacter johnsonii]